MVSLEAIKNETINAVWQAKIPIRISLRNCSVPDQPLPFYGTLPRFAYLPFLTHDVIQFFGRSVVDQVKHVLVFYYQGHALPWHIPVGVLYDVVAEGELPWRLEVFFGRNMPCELLPWEDDSDGNFLPIRKVFFNSLKESAYILRGWEGADRVTKLDLENKENLWKSAREADREAYKGIITNANFVNNQGEEEEEIPEMVPVRILLHKGRPPVDWKSKVLYLSRPLDRQQTLLQIFKSIFPDIEWRKKSESTQIRTGSLDTIDTEDEQLFRVFPSVHIASIEPDLVTSNLGWLYKTLKAPDCFLYITIKPNDTM